MANYLILMGNATKDPEVRYSADNKAVARLSLAVTRTYNREVTDFFDLVAFGKSAETIEKYVKKGAKLLCHCELRNNNYEKDGKKVYANQIVLNSFEFAGSKSSGSGNTSDGFMDISDEDLPFN